MSKRVYGLKRATPKMKYQHMTMVLGWRADLEKSQAEYSGEGECLLCRQPMGSRPFFMADEYDMCYLCYYALMRLGVQPPKHIVDLDKPAVLKLRALILKEKRDAKKSKR